MPLKIIINTDNKCNTNSSLNSRTRDLLLNKRFLSVRSTMQFASCVSNNQFIISIVRPVLRFPSSGDLFVPRVRIRQAPSKRRRHRRKGSEHWPTFFSPIFVFVPPFLVLFLSYSPFDSSRTGEKDCRAFVRCYRLFALANARTRFDPRAISRIALETRRAWYCASDKTEIFISNSNVRWFFAICPFNGANEYVPEFFIATLPGSCKMEYKNNQSPTCPLYQSRWISCIHVAAHAYATMRYATAAIVFPFLLFPFL